MVKIDKLAFYSINIDYLEFLHQKDSEVYYNSSYRNSLKPFLGIIIGIDDFNYFIPLTSAKEKHSRMKLRTREHLLVYEKEPKSRERDHWVYRECNEDSNYHIFGMLDIKKMIPVPEGLYQKINFDDFDKYYAALLNKEFNFCLEKRRAISKLASNLHKQQLKKGKPLAKHCNFLLLENAMKEWKIAVGHTNSIRRK